MKSSIFKTTKDFNDIFNFFKSKGMLEQPNPFDLEDDFKEIDHRYFEISSAQDLMFLAVYKNKDELKDSEDVLKDNIYVNYGILVKNDLSEYKFIKYDEGTDKILRLKKKKEDLNATFLKKLDKLEYDNFESFENIFDRSEFIKEFYQLYCDSEDYLIRNIKGIPEEEDKEFFANLLIQRLMFLWFLQKKGFLNDDINYFIDKFNEITSKKGNYYKDFLQKLFFSGLCKKENKRENYINKMIGDVPYLNGGLFIESEIELKYGNSIEISNEAFFREMTYPIQNHEHNIPVLNLLDCKDWTVNERSGEIDKLDPEILGYIFEKSINQKDLGAVYTPEDVTGYICKNTIYPYLIDKVNKKFKTNFEYKNSIEIEFLNNLDKEQLNYLSIIIKDLKILDPALGSGHFLVDAIITLEKVYNYLNKKNIINCSNNFQIRHYIITKNLYGVDLLPGAVEICKLRLFLALAETFETGKDVKPLPNIEFNIRSGNSLIGFISKSDLKQGFFAKGPAINAITNKIDFLRKKVPQVTELGEQIIFNAHSKLSSIIDPMDLFKIRNELVKEYKNIHNSELQMEFREVIYEITDAFNKELNAQFYGKIERIFKKDKNLKKLSVTDREKKFLELRPFHWIMEYSEVIEKGGFDLIIENPPYISFGLRGVGKLPSFLKEFYKEYYKNSAEYKISIYPLFFNRTIDLLKNGGYCGLITPDSFLLGRYFSKIRRYILDKTSIKEFLFIPFPVFIGVTVGTSVITILEKQNITKDNLLKCKLSCNMKNFIKNSFKLFSYPQSYFEKLIYNRFRLFFSAEEFNIVSTIEDSSDSKLKKYLTGHTGIRSRTSQKNIISKEHVTKEWKKGLISSAQIRRYYLNYDGDYIHINGDLLYGGGWNKNIIENPKVLIRQTGDGIIATIDKNDFYHLNNLHSFSPNKKNINLYSLLAILNSKLFTWYYRKISLEEGRTMAQTDIESLEKLPIKYDHNTWQILEFMCKILLFLNEGENFDYLDRITDDLIYELYLSKRFEKNGLKTNLKSTIVKYLFDIDSVSDKNKIQNVKNLIFEIKNDEEIKIELNKIESEPWVQIIEGKKIFHALKREINS